MELLAKQTYRAPDFELLPGNDTLHLDLPDERKARILEDFPDLVEEIVDVEAYLLEKQAPKAEVATEVVDGEPELAAEISGILASDPLTTAGDAEVEATPEGVSEEAGESEAVSEKGPKAKKGK